MLGPYIRLRVKYYFTFLKNFFKDLYFFLYFFGCAGSFLLRGLSALWGVLATLAAVHGLLTIVQALGSVLQ